MTTLPTTFRLYPLHPELLVCEACGTTVCTVDPSAALGRRVGALLEEGFEGAPPDELHGQEGPAIGESAHLMHGGDAGMLQLAGDPRLAEEALGGRRVGRVTLRQQLDG